MGAAEDLIEIKKQQEASQLAMSRALAELDVRNAALDEAMAELRELGINSLDEAKSRITELEASVEKSVEEIRDLIK